MMCSQVNNTCSSCLLFLCLQQFLNSLVFLHEGIHLIQGIPQFLSGKVHLRVARSWEWMKVSVNV